MKVSRPHLALAALLCMAGLIATALVWLYQDYRIESVAQVGRALPALPLRDARGQPVGFGRYAGRKLLVALVDPACGYCRDQFEVLRQLGARWPRLALVAIVGGDGLVPVDFSPRAGHSIPVWTASRRQVRRKWGVAQVPALFLLDEGGILRHRAIGYRALRAVESWLAEEEPG